MKGSLFNFFHKKEETTKNDLFSYQISKPRNKNMISVIRQVLSSSQSCGAGLRFKNYFLRKFTDEELNQKLDDFIRLRVLDMDIAGVEFVR
jgi:hypothetical protein